MSNNKEVVINTDNIKAVKSKMLTKCNELKDSLDTYLKMIDDTVSIYNTNAATKYREISRIYIKSTINYINNVFENSINDLDDIINIYDAENKYFSSLVDKRGNI